MPSGHSSKTKTTRGIRSRAGRASPHSYRSVAMSPRIFAAGVRSQRLSITGRAGARGFPRITLELRPKEGNVVTLDGRRLRRRTDLKGRRRSRTSYPNNNNTDKELNKTDRQCNTRQNTTTRRWQARRMALTIVELTPLTAAI